MNQRKKSASYQEELLQSLRDPTEAMEYLNEALLEVDMPEVFLLALRNVAEARGMSELSEQAKLNRESLYRMLSAQGNPQLSSLTSLLRALGLRLAVMEYQTAA